MIKTEWEWYTPDEKLPMSGALVIWITKSGFIDVGQFSKGNISYYDKWISAHDYLIQFSNRTIKFWAYADSLKHLLLLLTNDP